MGWRTMTACPFVTLWLTLLDRIRTVGVDGHAAHSEGRPLCVTRKLRDTDEGAHRRILGVVRCCQGARLPCTNVRRGLMLEARLETVSLRSRLWLRWVSAV